MTILNPYINFKSETKEAMAFYQTVFGGKLTMSTFKEGGMVHGEGSEDLIMHSMLVTDKGFNLMASDVPPVLEYKQPQGMGISLSGDDEVELTGYWTKLSDGATVTMPLAKAPWGDTFGMLTDKFGINWMVNITAKKT